MNEKEYSPGHIHCVLKLPTNPVKEITRLSVKLKLLTDTYILQAKRAKFGPTYATSALCPLCKEEDETKEHFLLKCSSLKLVREVVFNELATICQDELNLNVYVLSPETQ